MNKKYTFDEAIDLYKRMGERERDIIRRIASRRLSWQGVGEIGSSDVNHEIHSICNDYDGSFVDAMYEYLEDFLRGYKSLA
jgi:hypothetical protein